MKSQEYRPDPQDGFDEQEFEAWLAEQDAAACPLNSEELFDEV